MDRYRRREIHRNKCKPFFRLRFGLREFLNYSYILQRCKTNFMEKEKCLIVYIMGRQNLWKSSSRTLFSVESHGTKRIHIRENSNKSGNITRKIVKNKDGILQRFKYSLQFRN